MTNFYSINCGAEQAIITDKLKSGGVEVIQSSSGLVIKCALSLNEVEVLIGSTNCQVTSLKEASGLSPDIQKFVSES